MNDDNQELIYRLILLENQMKLLKEENEKYKEEINYLKKNSIIRELIDTLYPKDLKFNNGNFINGCFILNNKNSWQYGPYIKYEKGKYNIVYYGSNLSKLKFDCCDDEGRKILNISIIYKSKDKVSYEVFLPENNKCIEFRAQGISNNSSIIDKIEVYKYNY